MELQEQCILLVLLMVLGSFLFFEENWALPPYIVIFCENHLGLGPRRQSREYFPIT